MNKNRVFSITGEYVSDHIDNKLSMLRINSNGNYFTFDVSRLNIVKNDGMHTTDGTHIEYGDYVTVYGNVDSVADGVVLSPEIILKLLL